MPATSIGIRLPSRVLLPDPLDALEDEHDFRATADDERNGHAAIVAILADVVAANTKKGAARAARSSAGRADGHNFAQLKAAVLALSVSPDWEDARREWQLAEVRYETTPKTCPCGHRPIHELCLMENVLNGNEITVGNVCVRRFIDTGLDVVLRGVARIHSDKTAAMSLSVLAYFVCAWPEFFTEWEVGFLHNSVRKRKLSEKQARQRDRLNRKLLGALSLF